MAILAVGGCDMLPMHDTVKNPVVGPPPNRMTLDDSHSSETSKGVVHLGKSKPEMTADLSADQSDSVGSSKPSQWKKAGGIEQVNFEEPAPLTEPKRLNTLAVESAPLPETEVAATVNGVPILMSEVLEPFSAGLANAAKKAKPEEMRAFRQELVRRNLKPYIERQLLINALQSKLKEEQLQSIEKQLDKMFAEELQKLMKHYQVATSAELEVELQKQHTSLQAIKTTFRTNKMAQQYMAYKAGMKESFDRKDLLAWYHDHHAEYEYPSQVKWQQLVIESTKQGGAKKAEMLTEKLLSELENGADFDELAKKHSAGVTATRGGRWDWTREGSFADQELEKVLFQIRIGDIYGPHRTKQGFEILQVLERKEGGRKSFESVQEEIRNKLREKQYREAADQLLKELHEQAVIETKFDLDANKKVSG